MSYIFIKPVDMGEDLREKRFTPFEFQMILNLAIKESENMKHYKYIISEEIFVNHDRLIKKLIQMCNT